MNQTATAIACKVCGDDWRGCYVTRNSQVVAYWCKSGIVDPKEAFQRGFCKSGMYGGYTVYQERVVRTPPSDSAPDVPPPPWSTISEIGSTTNYGAGLPPVTTGYVVLDSALRGGFRPESLYVIGARTGGAKTTLALNIARRAALSDITTLICKIEESPLETTWRIHAAASQVPLIRLLDGAGKVTDKDEQDALADGWDLIRSIPLRISNQRDIRHIEYVVKEHVRQSGQLVVIDQISQIAVDGAEVGFQQATEASNRLRELAVAMRIPIVLAAQVNRAAAKNDKDRLTCHDLRDSGCIENDSAGVILIDRAREPIGPFAWQNPRTLEILIAKNRYGPTTKPEDPPLELHWHAAIGRIEDAVVAADQFAGRTA